ncbi:type I-B CRISPR-associated protein Cas5b [Clostridium sp. LQ25]|uniref:type I-B CRISPR-associated protein Cas5b n=1 Tax=Clostridium TaxID=1485 RepID=UPI001CA7F10C|nr:MULTISPECIES: type I-B CRISPR-associated protein Cas5b [Clostridium]MBZ0312581.1 type I-B CRISPR-associated protein Cas5b [Clostridium butyricum]MCQ2015238.1 type I-B CRISPR-associated protein Cas5b [Clostridium butyricum]MCQ2026677.1 type I-B CRISPR-associated protein Cas5b [Clostridium butyricum]UZT08702.1 type I-B CRISPR-associated protein Cas5b [Clostridium sp. LQ25]
MRILKFTLRGKSGFFKKPDVNSNLYFTYGNIHKVALTGLLGAILGYGGYNSMNMKNIFNKKKKEAIQDFPEFYERLNHLKVSIVPNGEKGFISKKVQIFNNSVGYASKEQGGNLIVKEQWLENPSWDIYIIIDDEESEKIEEAITKHKTVYTPYLGKNDHIADITDVEVINESEIAVDKEINKLDCLYLKDDFQIDNVEDDFGDFSDDDIEDYFKYEEKLPYELEKNTNMYITKSFICTNMKIKKCSDIDAYRIKEKNIVFY